MQPMTINILRYTVTYAVATLVFSALPQLLDLPAAAGVTAALPPLIGAIIEGQAHVRAHGVRATGAAAWRGALLMTGAALAVNAVLLGLANAITSGAVFAQTPMMPLLGGALALTIIQFGLNRLGIRLAPTGG